MPQIIQRESTMDAFKRLTNQRPWIPFNVGGNTKLDREEASLFDSLHSSYKRKSDPRANKGYFSLMKAWNIEVAERFKRHLEGDKSVVLINRRSVIQLQDYYGKTEGKQAAATRAQDKEAMDTINLALRNNRAQIQPLGEVRIAESVISTARISFLLVSTARWILIHPLRSFCTLHFFLIHSPLVVVLIPLESTATTTGPDISGMVSLRSSLTSLIRLYNVV